MKTEDLFALSLELPIEEQVEFVRQRAPNSLVRDETLKLLNHHHKNLSEGSFLDRTPSLLKLSNEIESLGEKPGDTLGDFRLLEKIGEGGMGVVYMAEQLKGVRRKVALKIIKLGMDTRQVVARFEVERQAMAMFDHPNIARVLAAGATESGRPYFVMELVRGTHICEFVEENELPLNERLDLFIAVCNAVQHAHQKGIIHRDLKPSNILVTLFDGVPVPKVIDFGIAKAIGQQLTDKTLFTRYTAMVGTPQYMSPEQAEMTGLDVDTRSDIYSLGVLLYELITGSPPLRKEQLKQLNPQALIETLREADIETPSSRLNNTGRNPIFSGILRTDSSNRIKNELDWIVMKALSRDRGQRYETASEFAADVKRYLDGAPVLAVPLSRFYRIAIQFRRHRTAVVTAFVLATVLLVSSVASGIFAVQTFRMNSRLNKSLESEKLSRRKADDLKLELENALTQQQYDTAHSQAFSKFMTEFRIYSVDAYTQIVQSAEYQESEGDKTVCRHFDSRWLLEFVSGQPVSNRGQKIIDSFDKMEAKEYELNQHIDSFLKNRGLAGLERHEEPHPHNQWCRLAEERTKEQLVAWRPKFFSQLVTEYRLVFGEHDPRVRDALTLLAASLIELEKFDLAESYLNQAIALDPDRDNEIEVQLLVKISTLR